MNDTQLKLKWLELRDREHKLMRELKKIRDEIIDVTREQSSRHEARLIRNALKTEER